MQCDGLELYYSFNGLRPSLAWNKVLTLIDPHDRCTDRFHVYECQLAPGRIADYLLKRQHFNIEGGGWSFDLGSSDYYNLEQFFIKRDYAEAIQLWDEWVVCLGDGPDFISAYAYDCEYEHWQNAFDILQYQAQGRSYAGLPMTSNGLPYPLEQQIIDTSHNPGRRTLRNGYVEAVGAVMWLTPLFFELTEGSLDALGAYPEIQVERNWHGNITRIQAGDHCFKSSDGRDGELQRILRRALFPKTAEGRPV